MESAGPIGVGQSGNFFWWEGVVEDNLDPLGAGRCKVRIFAHNTPDKGETGIPTAQLPWAYPIMPLNNPHGKIVALKPGTRVCGFFRDGMSAQDPVMMGTVNIGYENPGQMDNFVEGVEDPVFETGGGDVPIVMAAVTPRMGDIGFIDDRAGAGGPIFTQPKKSKVVPDGGTPGDLKYIDISDYGPLKPNEINTPRLARGISEGTIAASHALALSVVQRVKTLPGSVPQTAWPIFEPKTKFDAQYPFNAVEESDSGHLREIDDTPGAERIKETHRTGTFYEIHPDGTKVTKVVGDNFSVTIGDHSVKVEGVCAIHVAGEADFYCENDVRVRTEENATVTARKNVDVNGYDINATAKQNATVHADNNATVSADNNTVVSAVKNATVKVLEGNMKLECPAGHMSFIDKSGGAPDVATIIRDVS